MKRRTVLSMVLAPLVGILGIKPKVKNLSCSKVQSTIFSRDAFNMAALTKRITEHVKTGCISSYLVDNGVK